MNQDEKYMKAAIRQAKKAYALDEVPIGCVIVHDGQVIGRMARLLREDIIEETRKEIRWHTRN